MKIFGRGAVLGFAALLVAVTGTALFSNTASAQSGERVSGIIVGIDTDSSGRLTRFAVSDSSGTITTFEVSEATEYGLENQAGDRWVSTQGEQPVEVAIRLRDHRDRFAPVIVSFENGVATSVVEREEGKLETNLGYLFAVFAITWALFFAYVLYLGRKQRVLQYEIARLKGAGDTAK